MEPRNGRPSRTSSSIRWRASLITGLVVAVVGARGFTLAWLAGGEYPVSAFCFDSLALLTLMGVLHVLDAAMTGLLGKAIRFPGRWAGIVRKSVRLSFMVLVLFPFLIVAINVHPQRIRCRQTPEQWALPYEDVILKSDGLRLSAWYIPGETVEGPAIVVVHGIGANKENFLAPVVDLHERGYPVLIFDLRAHGNSEGLLTTYGMRESHDVKAAHDWLARKHPGQPICALGYSMGAAAVARAVHAYDIFDRVVLDSTFSRLRSITHHRFLRFFGPCESLVWLQGCFWAKLWTGVDFNENSTRSYVDALTSRPVLLIHGKQDRVIPYTESVGIHEAFKGRSELWLVENAGHAETALDPRYAERIDRFFRTGLPATRTGEHRHKAR